MRKMFLITALAVIMSSCQDDPAPAQKQQHTYTSLEGVWKFSSPSASGQLDIVNYSGKLTVDNGSGSFFTVAGKQYPVTMKRVVEGASPALFTFHMVNSTSTGLSLRECDVNKDYNEIVVKSFDYTIDGKQTIHSEGIKLTR